MKNYSMALQAKKNNQPDSALALIKRAIKIKPYISGFYETQAEIYLHLDSLSQAITSYHSALSYRSNNVPVLLQLSTLYLQKKDLATAFSLVSRAISQDGGDTDLYLFAAAIRLQEEKPDAAARLLTHYEKLVSPAGGNYFLVLSGVIHNRFKEWPQAVSRFKKVKDWAVQENVFLIEYIYALVRSGQTEIAYRILQQNKQKLSAGEFWLGRAIYYYGLNMPEEAGKNLNEALKVGCNTAFITYFLEMHQTDFPGMITEKKCQQYEYILKPPYAD